ncbi:MAG: ISAzo13-like element transposase-related protein [Endozoicomonas sp.]
MHYRRRKLQKKRTMGQNADRNAQFENISRLKKEYLDAGKSVISIDTRRMESFRSHDFVGGSPG